MASLFKSSQGKKEIFNLYDKKLDELGIVYEARTVETKFGDTHILASGSPSHPPLVVIHGSNGCAPIALETYINLLDSFYVYAVDVLAQPNKSAETRLSMKDDSYGRWMNELLKKLDLQNVVLAGFSFGGLVILKTLIHNEKRVKEVFLSAPAYIVNGNPLKALLRFFLPMKRYMNSGKPKYLNRFLDSAFTEKDEFAFKYLSLVFKHFKMDFTQVPTISKTDAAKIKTPITLFGAEKDILFPGPKMIKRAKKIFPSLKTATLLKDSKHVQNRADNDRIEDIIRSSLAK